MASLFQASLLRSILIILFVFWASLPRFAYSQQNIETFLPSGSSPAFPGSPAEAPPAVPVAPETSRPPSSRRSSSVGKAIGVTAASTLVISGTLFFLLQKFVIFPGRKEKKIAAADDSAHGPDEIAVSREADFRFDGKLKGIIMDENGLDVLYWRQLEMAGDDHESNGFRKKVLGRRGEEIIRVFSNAALCYSKKKSDPPQELPLLSGEFSKSSNLQADPHHLDQPHPAEIVKSTASSSRVGKPAPPPQPPPPPQEKIVAPPPPPPPPPPPQKKKEVPPPPPPPRPGGPVAGSKPPPAPPPRAVSKGKSVGSGRKLDVSSSEMSREKNEDRARLKPLHWDKLTPRADHSMVWDKIGGGSFRFDDELMEALFGYVATSNRKQSRVADVAASSTPAFRSLGHPPSPVAQIFLLDPRKSQNTAIVLRSLTVTRQEILDALSSGRGLAVDTLEKLTRIAPTQEEEALILHFTGNPSKLADAESFLYHLLRSLPDGDSPFGRLDAMLFKATYEPEILQLKQSLQTLELACKELRSRGLFLKLLEAVLKAGNRMNAGTARGNAQAFNLSALKKLSDVKSTDGKSTLLHFVVEQVVRAEGKRCVINRNHSLGRSNSSNNSDHAAGKEERQSEYTMLGLPIVGGLTVEFSNVKRAATIDLESFSSTCSALEARVRSIRQFIFGLVQRGGSSEGFVKDIKRFLEEAEAELKVVGEEEKRVVELVKRTYEYYQAGASAEKGFRPLQLFVTVKDFLGMVDQVCVDIARSLQQRNKGRGGGGGPAAVASPGHRVPPRFANLQAHFMSDNSKTSSSDSDDGF